MTDSLRNHPLDTFSTPIPSGFNLRPYTGEAGLSREAKETP